MKSQRIRLVNFVIVAFVVCLVTANKAPTACGSGETTGMTVVALDGSSLSLEQIVAVARYNAHVTVEDAVWARVRKGHERLILAARRGEAVYGLTTGLGAYVNTQSGFNEEAKRASHDFNVSMLRSHSAGVTPYLGKSLVRALLLVRLNPMLKGHSGAQESVVRMYVEFLNRGIHPLVPARGSVGQGDICLCSYVGLTMVGEHKVEYKGETLPAVDVLKAVGLVPLRLFAKDGLAILSSNAVAMARAALAVYDAERVIGVALRVAAVSMEAFNAQIAILLPRAQMLRPFRGQQEAAKLLLSLVEDGYLARPDRKRRHQDPLSYRQVCHILGAAMEALSSARERLTLHVNHSDDNPAVVLQNNDDDDNDHRDIIAPTANYDPLPVVLALEGVNASLLHVARAIERRLVHLCNARVSNGLPRFLAWTQDVDDMGFSMFQPAIAHMVAEVRAKKGYSSSADDSILADGIEDWGTNALQVASDLSATVDNVAWLVGMEIMHAAQAIDIRLRDAGDDKKEKDEPVFLSTHGRRMHGSFRKRVQALKSSRMVHEDMELSYAWVIDAMVDRGRVDDDVDVRIGVQNHPLSSYARVVVMDSEPKITFSAGRMDLGTNGDLINVAWTTLNVISTMVLTLIAYYRTPRLGRRSEAIPRRRSSCE